MATKKVCIVQKGNIVYVPVGLDVGNCQVKAIAGNVPLVFPSHLKIDPEGCWEHSLDHPRYLQAETMSPFVFGEVAAAHEGHYVGSDPASLKPQLAPMFLLAAIASTAASFLPRAEEELIVRPYLVSSLQHNTWKEKTKEIFAKLPKSIRIEKYGRRFVLDIDFMLQHSAFVPEGHMACRLLAKKKKMNTDILFIDIGGRTIHATNNSATGFSDSDTVTVEGGSIYLFERLLANPQLQAVLGKSIPVEQETPQSLEHMVRKDSDSKLQKLVALECEKWLSREENTPMWRMIALAARKGSTVVLGGGGIGITGFEKAFRKMLKAQDIRLPAEQLVFAHREFDCEAFMANAWSLHRTAAMLLEKMLKA